MLNNVLKNLIDHLICIRSVLDDECCCPNGWPACQTSRIHDGAVVHVKWTVLRYLWRNSTPNQWNFNNMTRQYYCCIRKNPLARCLSWNIARTFLVAHSSLHVAWACVCVLQFAAQMQVLVVTGCPWKPSIKGSVQHLLQVLGHDKPEVSSGIDWELLKVLLIPFGDDDTLNPCPMGCQDLILDPAHLRKNTKSVIMDKAALYCLMKVASHRQHKPPERDLSCHGNIWSDQSATEQWG